MFVIIELQVTAISKFAKIETLLDRFLKNIWKQLVAEYLQSLVTFVINSLLIVKNFIITNKDKFIMLHNYKGNFRSKYISKYFRNFYLKKREDRNNYFFKMLYFLAWIIYEIIVTRKYYKSILFLIKTYFINKVFYQ